MTVVSKSFSKKRVVVVGGSGFIGTHLIKRLLELDILVTNFDIVEPTSLFNFSVDFFYCDIREPILIDLPYKVDVLVNLAAIHRNPGHENYEYYLTNILGAINLCRWSVANGIGKDIFVSSISVYGNSTTLEERVSQPKNLSNYGYSKILAENVYLDFFQNSPNRLTIFRPAVIFGEGEKGNFSRLAKALKQRRFVIPTKKSIIKPCGYVTDFVNAIVYKITNQDSKLFYNFSFPNQYTIREICRSFHLIAGFGMPVILPLERLFSLGERFFPNNSFFLRASKLLAGNSVVPSNLLDENFEWEFDLQNALNDWKKSSNFDLEL